MVMTGYLFWKRTNKFLGVSFETTFVSFAVKFLKFNTKGSKDGTKDTNLNASNNIEL